MENTSTQSSQFSPQKGKPDERERFVAFLDIMGFKDMVARRSENKIEDKLEKLSTFIAETKEDLKDSSCYIFSDSIILFTGCDEQGALTGIISTVGKVVEKAIGLGLPIKGAIAKGICTVKENKQFYFGQPIIDAYSLEENIILYGVALHNSVEQEAQSLSKEFVFDFDLPLKGGTSKHYIVNWFANDIEENRTNLRNIRKTVSDSPRRYIDNTEKSIEYYLSL